MKLGIIAPIPHLHEFGTGPFHLILSHLLDQEQYMYHYQQEAKRGAFIVLDNSAYEKGEGYDAAKLLDQAIEVGARELVVPDVMHSDTGTIRAAVAGMEYFRKRLTLLDEHLIRLMIVPHASTIYKWGECLKTLVVEYTRLFDDRPFTIGVPKDYDTWQGGRSELIQRFIEPLRRSQNFEVHLLGVDSELLKLGALALRYPWIRSTDSAKPIIFAYHGIRLNTSYMPTPRYPGRPQGYFNLVLNDRQKQLAFQNCSVAATRAQARMVDSPIQALITPSSRRS